MMISYTRDIPISLNDDMYQLVIFQGSLVYLYMHIQYIGLYIVYNLFVITL